MDEQNRDNVARTQSVFGDIARIVYLGGDNCRITEKNGFIGIDAVAEIADDGTEEEKSASDAPNGERGEKKDESDAEGAGKDGEEKEIPLSNLSTGDAFVVRPGENFPADL